MEEGYLSIDGRKLWYGVFGRELTGTPLLVVHGGPGFSTLTDHFEELAVDRPIYFYDQSGGGKSDKARSPGDYSVTYFVDELAEVREALKLDPVILYGHSWGGTLVTSYYLERKPTGVKALILASPFFDGPNFDGTVERNIARLPERTQQVFGRMAQGGASPEEIEAAVIEYSVTYSCKRPASPHLMQAVGNMSEEVYGKMWGPNEFQLTGDLRDFDLTPRLHELDLPVLMMGGDDDEIPVEELRKYQLAIPGAQLAILPYASHTFQFDAPEVFQAIMKRFLQRLE